MKLKRYVLFLFILVLLALDWAALDDITTGNQPGYWKEYDMILFSIVLFTLLAYANLPSIKKWLKEKS